MPESFTFSFTFAGERYDDVVAHWGLDRPRLRTGRGGPARERSESAPLAPPEWWDDPSVDEDDLFAGQQARMPDLRIRDRGVGWCVEVPDVVRMLDAVSDGRVTADEVRIQLVELTQQFSQRSGCCVECDGSIEHYEQAVQRTRAAQARFDDAGTYPYLVTSNAIHDWDCYHFAGQRPRMPGRSVREFVHRGLRYWGGNEIDRLTPDEASNWMDARVGPKGARKWRRCKTCQPALPGAWASESNDVPTGRGAHQR